MPITEADIKLMAAEDLTDNPEGGGRMSPTEIVDGQVNQLFHGVDQLTAVTGRVMLRKSFPAVLTSDTDSLYGAHAILTDAPADPAIGMLLFAATDAADRRTDAAERIESFASKSLALSVKPLDDQFSGSTALLVPKGGDVTWKAGDIYYIGLEWTETDVVGLEKVSEYVKIDRVVDDGAYWRLILTEPLENTYPAQYSYNQPGTNPPVVVTIYPTVLRQTSTDQAATRYYGVSTLTGPITAGATSLQVQAHRQPVLPATTGPVVLIDQDPVGYAPLVDRQAPQLVPVIASVLVTAGNRSQSYGVSGVNALDASAIRVLYQSGGQVYEFRGGAASVDGALSYSAGAQSVSVSLARLPDLDSRVVVQYASAAYYILSTSYGFNGGVTSNPGQIDSQNRDLVPGTFFYRGASATYYDDGAGVIYRSDTDGISAVGTLDYSYPRATWTITDPIPQGTGGVGAVAVPATVPWITTLSAYADPDVIPGTFTIRATEVTGGALVTGTSDAGGTITGAGITSGTLADGLLSIVFDNPVRPETIRWDAQATKLTPSPEEQIGINPLRLPADGLVDVFRPLDVIVLHHTADTALPNPAQAANTYSVGRTSLKWIRLYDQDGDPVDSALYTTDPAAGTVTMGNPLDLSAYTQPLVARHRLEDMTAIQRVDPDGTLAVTLPIDKDFPADAQVSNCLVFGDLKARVSLLFDQQTWQDTWQDSVVGNPADASFNSTLYPIELTNAGAITERWVLEFTSPTHYRIIGETLGQIGEGDTTVDAGPVNPVTGDPYWVIRWEGWGSGWSAGNALRFNTIGASGPLWLAMVVQPGATPAAGQARIEFRGDVS